jgi:hypothetical protein
MYSTSAAPEGEDTKEPTETTAAPLSASVTDESSLVAASNDM